LLREVAKVRQLGAPKKERGKKKEALTGMTCRSPGASFLLLVGAIGAARGFLVGPHTALPRATVGACRRALAVQLTMNKALARPGQASTDAPSVALIGGGISGLACARRLKELGLSPTVFDTGKHAVGGRVSSRVLKIEQVGVKKPLHVKVDHSTQFFTATDERMGPFMGYLQKEGAVQEWKGPVGTLENGKFSALDKQAKLWVGRGGIDAVPKALAKEVRTVIDCWVAVVDRQQDSGKWRIFRDNNRRHRLSASDNVAADFDYLVVAHNGKCAERLMRDAQVPSLHRLLKTKFACTPPPAGVMQLSSLWVMTFAVEKSLGLPFEGAFVQVLYMQIHSSNTQFVM
jgi:hypothetical protein